MFKPTVSTPQQNIAISQPQSVSSTDQNIYYAGFWIRALAMTLDTIIIVVLLIILATFVSDTRRLVLTAWSEPGPGTWFAGSVSLLYFFLFTAFFGATPGKMLLGLRIVKDDLTRIDFLKAFLREGVGRLISDILLPGYLIVAFNKRKKGLHDFIAGTVIARKAPPGRFETPLLIILFLGGPILAVSAIPALILFGPYRRNMPRPPDIIYPSINPTSYIYPSPTPTPKLLPIPDYGPVESWKLFTNTRYGYSIRYPSLSSYEAMATEEFPTAETNFVVYFKSNDFLDDKRLFPWKISVTGEIMKSGLFAKEEFASYINHEIQEGFKIYSDKSSMPAIVSDTSVDGHRTLIVSNQKSYTSGLILYAIIERDQFSYAKIDAIQVADGDTQAFIKFFNQFVSTLKLV